MDIGTSQRIPNTIYRIVISFQYLLLFFFWQLGKSFCRCISDGTAYAQHGLEGFGRIYKNTNLCFHRLTKISKLKTTVGQ